MEEPMKKNNSHIEILIAEDSATQAEQLRQLLEAHHFKVTTAPNGKAALAQLELHQPALVISDVMMPELDGYGLCKVIKSDDKLKHIPVMLVTTLSDPDDVIRGLECGADNFIRKPYDERYLLSRIDYLLMNIELRKNQRMHMALEINLGGHKHFITAERQQILDLLVSTYEQAVQVNSELKEREKELLHSNQVLQGLNRIAEGLNGALSERDVADAALQRALALPGVQAGWIFLSTGKAGFRLAGALGLPPALSRPGAFDSDCICQRKLLSGELGSATNIPECERLAKAKGETDGLCCHASVPLWLGEDHLLGVMNLAGVGKGLFNEEQLKVLHSVGNQVAVALERARLHENLETLVAERTAKLTAEIEERKRIEQELGNERTHLAEHVAERTAALTVANEALVQAKAVAEEASRAKSAFLATMSHEIRTPMNGVIGMVDVLAQSKLSVHQADLASTIRESAGSLLGIIDDILDFSKIEAGRLELEHEPVCVADLVEGLCNSLVPVAARKGVELALFVEPEVPERVLSDDVRLRQVLYNLLGNAIKFSAGRPGKRGRVSVRVEVAQTAPLRLTLRVADNGIGMTAETVAGLFTPFTQAEISTTRRFGGTGLGLTICKRLVDLMQGEIAVESTPGAGSAFTVSLPFELAAEQPLRSQPDLSGLDCIVLESPHFHAGDLRAYLEHAGARVHLASDAAAAARLATRLAEPVVVIREAGNATEPSPLAAMPNLRLLLITRGRRRRARVEQTSMVTLDGDALRRQALLRAVAVAAGRASPEIFQERSEKLLAGEVEPPTLAEARAQGRLILVVEDDEINQKVILQQLALLGYAAEIAGNGVEALRLWRGGRYALLLTDLHMPEMDGYTLADTIRHEEAGRSRIPILALTANALRGEANRARAAGLDEYMTKPVQLSALRSMLEKWMPQATGSTAPAAPQKKNRRPETSIVDITVLENLIGDNPATVNEFLTDYLTFARHLAVEMHAAVDAGDPQQIGFIAHKLKSSSRSVGALALGDLCAGIENSAKTGDMTAIAQGMAQFDVSLAKVEAKIAGILAGQ
jgi:signal transduction histidine kinase/DNA-binding response OmpR family regulator